MIAVVTTVTGRHEHLRLQRRGLRAGTRIPDLHVVVSMGDPEIGEVCTGSPDTVVVNLPVTDHGLPIAAARNAGAERALRAGADVLVFLDVDCVPAKGMLARYAQVAGGVAPDSLLSGAVTYLPRPPETGYVLESLPDLADTHPARPAPGANDLRPLDHELFWSLSFAANAAVWPMIGGFCERYRGYGGEDTDFAQLARARGVSHIAVGAAEAYHQWHPTTDPPLQHLDDIVRNGRLFRERWGWWPMTGWLDAFRELGLTTYDPDRDDWTRAGPSRPRVRPQPFVIGD